MSSDGAKLLRAAAAGDDAKVKRLLKAKVDVNHGELISGRGGVTALQVACANGHVGAVRLLLKAKATLDLRDSNGGSALNAACAWNRLECAQLLLEAKATIDLASNAGATPLLAATYHGYTPVVQLLLEAKASTTARSMNGNTALDCARREGHAACVALLEASATARPHSSSRRRWATSPSCGCCSKPAPTPP